MKIIFLFLVIVPWMAFATSPRNELTIINENLNNYRESINEKIILKETSFQSEVAEKLAKEISANLSAKEQFYLDAKNAVK